MMGNVQQYGVYYFDKVFHCGTLGPTPLHWSCERGYDIIVNKLIAGGADTNARDIDGFTPLHISCQEGHDVIVDELIGRGANINVCDKDGVTPLYISCQEGHDVIVNKLIQSGADINAGDGNGITPLYISCQNGHIVIVNKLLESGVFINPGNDNTKIPLYISCQEGHDIIVKKLIESGADTNAGMKNGNKPLHISCKKGRDEVVKILIERGANINDCNKDGVTPLHIACKQGRDVIAKRLIESGADINAGDKNGFTSLHISCKKGCDVIVNQLIESGATINVCDKDGVTPLHSSCQEGHDIIVKTLLESGADINVCDKDGVTPLHISCQEGHGVIVDLLIESGATINVCDKDGVTPLHSSCQEGHDIIVKTLLESGADINAGKKNGITPLHISCLNGHDVIVNTLIKSGAEINACDIDGFTPLHISCVNGHDLIVNKLTASGADTNARDIDGYTPLHIVSCLNGHDVIVKKLIESDADINICNEIGLTPLHMSCLKGHDVIVNILTESGAHINASDTNGFTSFHLACLIGHDMIVDKLIESGADINATLNSPYLLTRHGHNRSSALLKRHAELIYLRPGFSNSSMVDSQKVGRGIDPFGVIWNRVLKHSTTNTMRYYEDTYMKSTQYRTYYNTNTDDEDLIEVQGNSALIIACVRGHETIVDTLIQHNAEVNCSNAKGDTALMYSCARGHQGIMNTLNKHGAHINVRDRAGLTALMYSCKNGHDGMSHRLLELGANINVSDEDGRDALMYSCISGLDAFVDTLLELGANLNTRDHLMKNALLHSCENGKSTIVRILLKNGANIASCDVMLKTALIYAAINGHLEIVAQLIDHDALLDFKDRDGKTALMYSSEEGHCEVVKLLISNGADVNAYGVTMKTPLMYSCLHGQYNVVNYLIEHNVNVNACDTQGKTSLWYAAKNGHDEIMKKLKQHGATLAISEEIRTRPVDGMKNDGTVIDVQVTDNSQLINTTSPTSRARERIGPRTQGSTGPGSGFGLQHISGCPPGKEIISEVAEERQGKAGQESCDNDHTKFKSLSEFGIKDLPEEHQTQDHFEAIKRRCDLTVRVEVNSTSEERPYTYTDGTRYPFAFDKGTDNKRYGTGTIINLLMDQPITNKPCPCYWCKDSIDPKMKWWEMTVCTATHVIFDQSEAKNSKFRCFFGEDETNIKVLYGRDIQYSITRIDTMSQSDLTEVLCVTHDEETVEIVSDVLDTESLTSSFSHQPSSVIVSYPHGCDKKISVGNIMYLTVPLEPDYETGTPFSFMNHTRCRLPKNSDTHVEKRDNAILEMKEGRETLNTSVSSGFDQTPSTSCNVDPNSHNTNVSSVSDQTPSTSCDVDHETQYINVSSGSSQTPSISYDSDHDTPPQQFPDTDTESIFDMLYKDGCKNYVSIYLIPAMKGGLKVLEYMIMRTKDKKGYSRSDVIRQLHIALPEINSDAKKLTDVITDDTLFRSKIESYFEDCKEEYLFLAKQCDGDTFFMLRNELFNIFFPHLSDLIFNQNKNSFTRNTNEQDEIQNYTKLFPEISRFYLGAFEDIHPEYEIIESFLKKNFEEIMDFTISFMRGVIFHSIRKCPTKLSTACIQPGSKFTLPIGMTFTLPPSATYAFRYHQGKPGWYKFPPKTLFALRDGTSVILHEDAEFWNDALYPKQCYVTHNIPTCPGSSGAAVFCNLLGMPPMTLFPHRGQRTDSDIRQSGVQTNRFCTLLENISNILAKIATDKHSV